MPDTRCRKCGGPISGRKAPGAKLCTPCLRWSKTNCVSFDEHKGDSNWKELDYGQLMRQAETPLMGDYYAQDKRNLPSDVELEELRERIRLAMLRGVQ